MHVFIIGSKGVPARYGGFETFVQSLVTNSKRSDITYYISCLDKEDSESTWENAKRLHTHVPHVGSATAILYDIKSLMRCVDYVRQHNLKDAVIYILASRIGPFLKIYRKKIRELGIKIYVNPDGQEWKRSKWGYFVKQYWKVSERLTVMNSDLVVCDSKEIQRQVKERYNLPAPKTVFIPYGADVNEIESKNNSTAAQFYKKYGIRKHEFYLIVGRFVPENNYELIIREFMNSDSKKDLIIVSNMQENKFWRHLQKSLRFHGDVRIKFVGTVYDRELLEQIRNDAYGYIHGHEVGGTNPSLLEAMACTKLNLLLSVEFNKEVGGDATLYFSKLKGDLKQLLKYADKMAEWERENFGTAARRRVLENYTWSHIVQQYEDIFISGSLQRVREGREII